MQETMHLSDGDIEKYHYILNNCTRDEVERAKDVKEINRLVGILQSGMINKKTANDIKRDIDKLLIDDNEDSDLKLLNASTVSNIGKGKRLKHG